MGLETFCFAWPDGAVCKNAVNHFIPISIFEMDKIVCKCMQYGIDGVVSNASESTALVVSYVAEKLGKNVTPYSVLKQIQDKCYVRDVTNKIKELVPVEYKVGCFDELCASCSTPFIIKPVRGASKKGVNYVDTFENISVPESLHNSLFIAEQYIIGKEYSVESISYKGMHHVIQITEKVNTGAPHFVELEHHQPATLSDGMENRIKTLIPEILDAVGFTNGASHIEIKIDDENNIYLIEINPRGGGDFISNELVSLSTDYDYLKNMILVALDMNIDEYVHNTGYAGVYFLSAYTSRLLPYFDENRREKWMVFRERTSFDLTMSSSNYDRDGYIIYKSDSKISI